MQKLNNPDLVIYHGGCADGTVAAWVFWQHAKSITGLKMPKFYAAKHGDPPIPLDQVLNKEVVMVDFSYKREIIEKILRQAKRLVILDHHKSNQKELEGLSCAIFDMERAGCQLAWDYVYPPDRNPPKPRPHFVNVVADRDLWTWKLPGSQAINKVFYLRNLTKTIEDVDKIPPMNLGELAKEGKFYLDYETQLLDTLSRFTAPYRFPDHKESPTRFYKVLVTEAVYMISELGHKISEGNPDYDFVILYRFDNLKQAWYFSCRAREKSELDLGDILRNYGGGGHPKAAGFEVQSSSWPGDILLPVSSDPPKKEE